MDPQWRSPPLCPLCSIPHFPFCPPPPHPSFQPFPFPQNPNHNHWDNIPPPPPPFPYPNFRPPPHEPQYPPSDYVFEDHRNLKRPRLLGDETCRNFSDDDERRLKLIRDHGVALGKPPQDRIFTNGFHSDVANQASHSHTHNAAFSPFQHAQFRPQQKLDHHDFHSFCHHEGSQTQNGRYLYGQQPPLPSSPPPPLPLDPPMNPQPKISPPLPSSSYPKVSQVHHLPQHNFHTKPFPHSSAGFHFEEPSKQFLGDAKPFSVKKMSDEKPTFINASHLFKHPHRITRPDHLVIILRGLPGSGKSYLAKMLRDLEVENGGDAPRIHAMDDYFMTEVEKVDDNDASKSASSGRGKKPVMKMVMEYCYEPEMEEAYRSSMLKAFKKNVEEGSFTFIIVDDRNLRVADFAQFWATAKRSGYEVYILEAAYKDPAGCAARNVHGFTQEDIEKMAGQWEEASSLYLQLDVKSLFHGDDLKESRILEVDMDMEDDIGDALPVVQGRDDEKIVNSSVRDDNSDGSLLEGKKWDTEEHPTEVRELHKSKWSEQFDVDENDQADGGKGNLSALSGLINAHGRKRKSVHWADRVGDRGFSIGSAKKANVASLVIGPGAGYNLKSNPLVEENSPTTNNSAERKRFSIFQERIRAECESFKAVFDKRRQRISGLDVDDD